MTSSRGDEPVFVQVRYPTRVPAQAPDGWVTVAVAVGRTAAAKHAAEVYRGVRHPEDSYPQQVRLRSERGLLAAGGEDAVRHALESLRQFAAIQGDATDPRG